MSSQIQNYYPVFAPNQVLTDTQLNHLRIYLDEQNRLTRTRMIGTGIICGFHASHEQKPTKTGEPEIHLIHISEGYGVSSDGYIIELPEKQSYRQYKIFTGIDADEDGAMDYETWKKAKYEIFELIPVDGTTGTDKVEYQDDEILELQREHIDCRILVLYLECRKVDLKSCAVTDCSNKGEQLEFNVKALLVHQNDLEAVLPKGRLMNEDLTTLKSLQLHVPRLHTAIDDPTDLPANEVFQDCKLLIVNEARDINDAYMDISVESAEIFIKHMKLLWEDNLSRCDLLNLPDIGEQLDQLAKWFDGKRSYVAFNQYHFSMMRDLACGFNEFLACYCQLVKCCDPPSGYPKHLMIRRFFEHVPAKNGGMYRHDFAPSPVRNVMYEKWEIARDMFMRLIAMIENFREAMLINYTEMANNSDGIRITPSQNALHPLGNQAVPYYFRVEDGSLVPTSLINYWQAASSCMLDYIQSYYYHKEHLPDTAFPAYPAYPLHYDIRKFSFYRIEGHLGMNCEKVVQTLEVLCKVHNLEFDVLLLYTDYPEDYVEGESEEIILFREFAAKKWGLEHLGGVQPGGTFVLVCDPKCPGEEDDIVIADFALACCVGELKDREPINLCPAISDFKQNPIGVNADNLEQYEIEFEVETLGPKPEAYIWDFGDGSPPVRGPVNSLAHYYQREAGRDVIYLVRVTIPGNDRCQEDTRTLEVTIPKICPKIGQIDVIEGELTDTSQTFDLSLFFDTSIPARIRPDEIEIQWGDASNTDTFTSFGSISHTYDLLPSAASYEVVLKAIGPGECESFYKTNIDVPALPDDNGTSGVAGATTANLRTSSKGLRPEVAEDSGARSILSTDKKGSDNLSNRRQARVQAMYAFNESGAFSKNRTYASALEFVSNDDIAADKLGSEFKDALGKLKSVYKRASGQKQNDYQQMILLTMQAYMDRLVEVAPSALPTDAKETLTEEITDLKSEFGIKAADLKKAWSATALKKISDAKVIDQINRLIK